MDSNDDYIIPKEELKQIMKRFRADKKRGIPMRLFYELSGVDKSRMDDMFFYDRAPMTELVQRRVSKAYLAWKRGEVAVMIRFGQKWLEWRKQPKPVIVRGYGLQMGNDGIKLKIGLKNRLDYSDYRLDEQLKGR
jgi:hypothetical protein